MQKIVPLDELVHLLQQIPYIGTKNIYKLVDLFLSLDEVRFNKIMEQVKKIRENLLQCDHCFFLRDRAHPCQFCSDQKRIRTTICVVERWQEVLAIEKTNAYQGLYHVLGGALSPLEGVTYDKLTIDPLVTRVEKTGVTEVILATNQTPEGEATAMFIDRRLKGKPVTVSCLARGLPVGSFLTNSDQLTIYKALIHRRPF